MGCTSSDSGYNKESTKENLNLLLKFVQAEGTSKDKLQ